MVRRLKAALIAGTMTALLSFRKQPFYYDVDRLRGIRTGEVELGFTMHITQKTSVRVRSKYVMSANQGLKRAWAETVGGKCMACGSTEELTVDHIKPRFLGGGMRGNLQLLCYQCNIRKGTDEVDYRRQNN